MRLTEWADVLRVCDEQDVTPGCLVFVEDDRVPQRRWEVVDVERRQDVSGQCFVVLRVEAVST